MTAKKSFWDANARMRIYGDKGRPVVVLHGGPSAAGTAEPIAKGLSKDFHVYEPWQRASGDIPLSVAVHISDLNKLITSICPNIPPAIVGESWGAMLALAYATEHPDSVSSLALVSCGTFDEKSRGRAVKIRKQRIADHIKKHPDFSNDLQLSFQDQVMKWHDMTDNYDIEPSCLTDAQAEEFDMKAHTETWRDMMRCQEECIYPQSFTAIKSPVIMLHGEYDPHPGKMIRDDLKKYIPHLQYHEFSRCGHSPATERYVREYFFRVLCKWLKEQ